MKSLWMIVVIFLCGLPTLSFSADCTQFVEGSTARPTCQSAQAFEKIDKILNIKYKKVISTLSKPEQAKEKQLLIESQRAWVSYREKQCSFEQHLANVGGSVTLMDCRTDLTKERTSFLNRL